MSDGQAQNSRQHDEDKVYTGQREASQKKAVRRDYAKLAVVPRGGQSFGLNATGREKREGRRRRRRIYGRPTRQRQQTGTVYISVKASLAANKIRRRGG